MYFILFLFTFNMFRINNKKNFPPHPGLFLTTNGLPQVKEEVWPQGRRDSRELIRRQIWSYIGLVNYTETPHNPLSLFPQSKQNKCVTSYYPLNIPSQNEKKKTTKKKAK